MGEQLVTLVEQLLPFGIIFKPAFSQMNLLFKPNSSNDTYIMLGIIQHLRSLTLYAFCDLIMKQMQIMTLKVSKECAFDNKNNALYY